MVTARALSLALLLAFALCLAASARASAPKQRQPTNRIISYAGMPHGGDGNGAGHSGIRQGCSVLNKRCHPAQGGVPAPVKAGAKTAAAGWNGALSRDQNPGPLNAGAKTGAAGSKGRYISRGALSKDKLCWPLGCPRRP